MPGDKIGHKVAHGGQTPCEEVFATGFTRLRLQASGVAKKIGRDKECAACMCVKVFEHMHGSSVQPTHVCMCVH